MKKYFAVICCAALLSLAGFLTVRAGYYTGPNNSLYVESKAGFLWLEGTLANNTASHYKKIYVQTGSQGSWSGLVGPGEHSVTRRDTTSIFDNNYAFLNPCWKVNSGDNLSCRS